MSISQLEICTAEVYCLYFYCYNRSWKRSTPWLGEVSFLQNDHVVLDIPVQEMNPHIRPCIRSSRASLNPIAPWASLGREGHAVRTRLLPCGRGCQTPSLLCRLTILCLHVICHISIRHILPVLYPSLLPLPVGGSLSHHPSPVRRLQLGLCRLAWAADHADCLPNIIPQAQPIEQDGQGNKCTLEPSWVQRCNHAIIRIEEGILTPTPFYALSPLSLSLHHHRHPVSHHRIHHHIEYGVGDRISLSHSSIPLKNRLVMLWPCHHCQPPLIRPD